jgi:PAS domain S-box-containing protein
MKAKDPSKPSGFFAGIFKSLPDPVFIRDHTHHLVFANDAFCRLTGTPAKAIPGLSMEEIFPADVCDMLRNPSGHADNLEITLTPDHGPAIRFLVAARSYGKTKNAPEIFILRDITAIRKAEDALKESEAFSSTLINHLPNPILIHINRVVVFANDIIPELMGLAPEEIIGKDLSELFIDPVDPMSNSTFRNMLGESLKEEAEIEIRTANRKVIIKTLLLRNRRIKYKGQDAVLTILFDITERKKVAKYILSKVIETEEKDRKRFAEDLHDDLGPTLSGIKLQLGLLQEAPGANQFLKPLKACNVQLAEAISKMRIIANNLTPRLIGKFGIEAALNAFFATIVKNGVFSVEFDSNLNGTRFPGEIELHLYRIVCELINNTVKHSNGTKSIVKLRYSKGVVKVFYTDDGKGYDFDEIQKRSSGMGLSNIMHRVNLIDGHVSFRNICGRTEVRIRKEL